jgi:hypothetical protein
MMEDGQECPSYGGNMWGSFSETDISEFRRNSATWITGCPAVLETGTIVPAGTAGTAR